MTLKLKFFFCLTLVLSSVIIPNCNASIIYPQAPAGGEQAVSNFLNSKVWPVMHLPSAKDLTIARPFGAYCYVANYTNLFAGRFLSATEFAGWYFLLSDGTNSAELQLQYDEKKQEWPAMGWMCSAECPISNNTILQTLQAAENLPQVKQQDYELRYLNYIGMPFSAVWLHGKSSDILVPVPMYGKWQDFHPYSEAEITKILKREIEEQMKQPAQHGPPWRVD